MRTFLFVVILTNDITTARIDTGCPNQARSIVQAWYPNGILAALN
jgi:hypothetical protein